MLLTEIIHRLTSTKPVVSTGMLTLYQLIRRVSVTPRKSNIDNGNTTIWGCISYQVNRPIGVSLGCELLRLDLLTSQVEILSDVLWLKRKTCMLGGIPWQAEKLFLFFLKMFLKKMLRINELASYQVSVMICLRIYFQYNNIRIPFTLHVAAKHLLQVAIVHWPIFCTGRWRKLVSRCNDHLSGIKFLIFE